MYLNNACVENQPLIAGNQALYLPSNNFKHNPSQNELTVYALGYLSVYLNITTYDRLPHNIRVKNLFDNHLWVLNNYKTDTYNLFLWVDFGKDNLSVAQNDGQLGLVTGSNDVLSGHVDLMGKITINGLQEKLETLYCATKQLQTEIKQTNNMLTEKINQINIHVSHLKQSKN